MNEALLLSKLTTQTESIVKLTQEYNVLFISSKDVSSDARVATRENRYRIAGEVCGYYHLIPVNVTLTSEQMISQIEQQISNFRKLKEEDKELYSGDGELSKVFKELKYSNSGLELMNLAKKSHLLIVNSNEYVDAQNLEKLEGIFGNYKVIRIDCESDDKTFLDREEVNVILPTTEIMMNLTGKLITYQMLMELVSVINDPSKERMERYFQKEVDYYNKHIKANQHLKMHIWGRLLLSLAKGGSAIAQFSWKKFSVKFPEVAEDVKDQERISDAVVKLMESCRAVHQQFHQSIDQAVSVSKGTDQNRTIVSNVSNLTPEQTALLEEIKLVEAKVMVLMKQLPEGKIQTSSPCTEELEPKDYTTQILEAFKKCGTCFRGFKKVI